MQKNRMHVRGYAANPVLIVGIAALAVGVVVGAVGTYWYMSSHQGGLGEGEELAPFEESVAEIPSEEMTIPTEAMTQPDTQELTSVEIIVAGNVYLYRNAPITLDGVLGILQVLDPGIPVKVTDENASLHAYQALTDLLDEQNVRYIEAIA